MYEEDYEKLYTVKELVASNRLRISKTTIWRRIEEDALSYYRLGGQVFVSDRHIREYLSQCEVRRVAGSKSIGDTGESLALRK